MTVKVFETTYSPFLLQMTVTMVSLAPVNTDRSREILQRRILWLITVTVLSHGLFMVLIRFPAARRARRTGLAL